jgi:voltage-gated potassium channel
MTHHKIVFNTFVRHFISYFWLLRHIMLTLLALVVLDAIVIALVEGISIGDSVYFSFITAFTIGYGDIAPLTIIGRVLSVVIGLIGIIFTGLVVAISARALATTLKEEKKNKS